MKTHLLKPGVALPKTAMHSSTRCGTNKTGVVAVSIDMEVVDCGRCQQLRLRDAARTTTVAIREQPKESFEDKFELGTIVHWGSEEAMCDPDESTFCKSRVGRTAIAYETNNAEEVTCTRCKVKISKV